MIVALSIPDWSGDTLRYMLEEGLVNTLRVSAIALVGAVVIGVTLGTLLTIKFLRCARSSAPTSRSGAASRSW